MSPHQSVPDTVLSRGLAHRILLPAFGPLGIKAMFPGMADIASQLLSKVCAKGSAEHNGQRLTG